ncbi:hypothetical protein O6H91_16G035300 [Diphasiastrum complanatum]|uniref:Uncharacterized protein n=1 Tax=Diphasiastrum complanatum TaxID=34168 RepID=A0ACC2BBC1_DIPCM|nr:hypothetical protein O6H91_16G035300 [Diphasiastrum complanatum]
MARRGEEDCGQKSDEKKKLNMLIGEPTFEAIGKGRVRCVETGHEMPQDQAPAYGTSKKCLEALFDRALAQRRPPLNFFLQSPDARNMVICKLSGAVVKKNEDSIWKHVMGKKFQKKLEEEEAKKFMPAMLMSDRGLEGASISESVRKPENDGSEENENIVSKNKGKKKLSKEGNLKNETAASRVEDNINQDEEPNFWIPPLGDRWDFDCGGGRWTASDDQVTSLKIEQTNKGCQVECGIKVVDNKGMEVGMEGDSENEVGSDSEAEIIRMKRLSLSRRSSKSANLKKKRRIKQ